MEACEARDKLKRVLEDPIKLQKSALKTFQQFDPDGTGKLDVFKLKKLLVRLAENLCFCSVDDPTLSKILKRYDTSRTGFLSCQDFLVLYADLLALVKAQYYKPQVAACREDFVTTTLIREGDSISNHLIFRKSLGSGSFGEAHFVSEVRSQLHCVCKSLSKHQAKLPISQIYAEIEILRKLDHPNIIKIYDVYEDNQRIYICMEHCRGKELSRLIEATHKKGERLPEARTAAIVADILDGLSYIHRVKHVAHKDLKPDNVMFWEEDQQSVKIIDFGVAEMFHRANGSSTRAAGTALYMAPEVIQRKFGVQCDVWSCGCILYLLLTGRYPFIASTWEEMKNLILHCEPNFQKDCGSASPEPVALVRRMLTKDPSARPTVTELLNEPWILRAREMRNCKNGVTPGEFSAESLRNIASYSTRSSLKNTFLKLMAHQMALSGAQGRTVIDDFKAIDLDGNGAISSEELESGLRKSNWSTNKIKSVMKSLHLDRDEAYIEFTEFLAAAYTWRLSDTGVVYSAFSKIDRNKDGRISSNEFEQLFMPASRRGLIAADDINEIMIALDRDCDGYIIWEEFLDFIRKAHK